MFKHEACSKHDPSPAIDYGHLSEQETNSECLTALTKLLTDTLNTGEVDYLTPENTAVIDVQQLPALVIPEGRRRSLLQLPAAWRGGGGPSAEVKIHCHHLLNCASNPLLHAVIKAGFNAAAGLEHILTRQ